MWERKTKRKLTFRMDTEEELRQRKRDRIGSLAWVVVRIETVRGSVKVSARVFVVWFGYKKMSFKKKMQATRNTSRLKMLERLESLERSIEKERDVAFNVEMERNRLRAVIKTNEHRARERNNPPPDSLTTGRRSRGVHSVNPRDLEYEGIGRRRKEKFRMYREDGTRSITSEVTELETPRYPRKTTDITRHIDAIARGGSLQGTKYERKDNRRVRTDVTLSAENYLCAKQSPNTVPINAKFGIKYDSLIMEAEVLHNSMAYHRLHKTSAGNKATGESKK